jgi:TRAP-type C4-dicarboxylate transport system permease small subunit
MDAYIRVMRRLSQLTGIFAALLIGLAVLVICDMVIERYVLNLTTIWQIDVVTYSIVAATFIGSPYVLMNRGHVNVDILPLHLGPRARFWLAMATGAISIAFCIVLWYLTTKFWYEAYTENWRSNTVWRARLWIPYLSMPVGLGLLVLQYVAELLATATGRQLPFGMTPGATPTPDVPLT